MRKLVRLMSEVVLGISPSVHSACQDALEPLGVSVTAVYDKLAGLELAVSAAFVRDSAEQFAPVIAALGGETAVQPAGYRVLILDGNVLAGTEHRLDPLRRLRAAALAILECTCAFRILSICGYRSTRHAASRDRKVPDPATERR